MLAFAFFLWVVVFVADERIDYGYAHIVFTNRTQVEPHFTTVADRTFGDRGCLCIRRTAALVVVDTAEVVGFAQVAVYHVCACGDIFVFVLQVSRIDAQRYVSIFDVCFRFVGIGSRIVAIVEGTAYFQSRYS